MYLVARNCNFSSTPWRNRFATGTLAEVGAKRRIRVAGLYHVWANAVSGSDLFMDPLDYRFALELIAEAVARGGFECNAFSLVDTHYHLLVTTDDDDVLSERMQRINRRHALRINRKYIRRGHVFDGRFESKIVEADEHLMELTRYLALQTEPGIPAAEHLWSSYPALIGLRPPLPFVNPGPIVDVFGGGDRVIARIREFVEIGRELRARRYAA